jgi:hypothetical protein
MRAPSILFFTLLSLVGASRLIALPNEQRKEAIVSHIPRERVDSSAIAAVGYSKKLHALEIEFVNGAAYRYLGVPGSLYRDLMAADSKARFYDKNIRARYRSIHIKPRKKK